MKNKESLMYGGLAAALVCGVAGVMIARHNAAREAEFQAARSQRALVETRVRRAAKTAPASAPAPTPALVAPKLTNAGRSSRKEPARDPAARAALILVGADPVSEQYWIGAINNPFLPAHERRDLIEDLNEDGLSNPKHPGPEDLPLIRSRLRLIEQLKPDAMDQVNAEAFEEAHKDLTNMVARLTRP